MGRKVEELELAGCIPSTIQDQEVMCATAQITPSILLSLAFLSTVKIGFPMSGNTFQTIPPRHACPPSTSSPTDALGGLPHGMSRYDIINNINHYTSFSFISLYLFTLETGFLSCCPQTHQTDLEITTILLNQPSKYWAYRCDSLLI